MEREGFKFSKRRVSSLWITNLVYVHNWASKIIFINTFNNRYVVSKNKFFASLTMILLMIGALLMHLKVNDPLKKSLPALTIIVLLIGAILQSSNL